MSEPLLCVRELCVRARQGSETSEPHLRLGPRGGASELLRDISFALERGQSLGLVGRSGAGKTTLALALVGLLEERWAVSGHILYEGQELARAGARTWRQWRGRHVGLLPQEPLSALDPVRTVGSQLVETLRAHQQLTRAQARSRAADLLSELGIAHAAARLHAYGFELSGGERQRVLLALALSGEPALLIADEPTSALDPGARTAVCGLLARLRASRHLALLLITHDLALASNLVEHIAVMERGAIVETGGAADVLFEPRSAAAQELLRFSPRRAFG